MFKDVYKAANDDIKPDPYLLARVLNKASEKPKPFIYRHRAAIFAAVIALFIALPAIFNPSAPNNDTVLDNTILPEAQNDEMYFVLSKKTAEESAAGKSSDSVSHITEYDYTHTETTPSKQHNPLSEMTVVMSINNIVTTPQTANFMRVGDNDLSAHLVTEEITAGQYFDQLGFSPDKLVIPQSFTPGFSNDTSVTVTKLDGEIISDENTFFYSGEHFLMLTTSSKTENAMSYINSEQYEKSIFGDEKAVILYDGSVYEAHIVHSSDTALKFVTDMSEEDLKNLLVSAAK